MPRKSTACFRVSVPPRRMTSSFAEATSVPMRACDRLAEPHRSTRRSRALSPAENVPDDDFAQINHNLPQPPVLTEQFVHVRRIRSCSLACGGAAGVRDESLFWSLVCHGLSLSRQPERSSPLRIVLALQSKRRHRSRISSFNGEILAENSAENLSARSEERRVGKECRCRW